MVEVKKYTLTELDRSHWFQRKSFWPVKCDYTGVWTGFREIYYTYNFNSKRACYAFACAEVAKEEARAVVRQEEQTAQRKLDEAAQAEYSLTKYFKIESRYNKECRKTVFDLSYDPIGILGHYANKIEYASLQKAEDAVKEINELQNFKEKYYGKTIVASCK